MVNEYSTSPRTATSDAAKLRDDGNTNTTYGAKPQNNPLGGDQKGGDELFPERTALFEFRIGAVDKYGWGEWEGEVLDVREKMRRMGFLICTECRSKPAMIRKRQAD